MSILHVRLSERFYLDDAHAVTELRPDAWHMVIGDQRDVLVMSKKSGRCYRIPMERVLFIEETPPALEEDASAAAAVEGAPRRRGRPPKQTHDV